MEKINNNTYININSIQSLQIINDKYYAILTSGSKMEITKDQFDKLNMSSGSQGGVSESTIGNLTDLTTNAKNNLVGAINEVNGKHLYRHSFTICGSNGDGELIGISASLYLENNTSLSLKDMIEYLRGNYPRLNGWLRNSSRDFNGTGDMNAYFTYITGCYYYEDTGLFDIETNGYLYENGSEPFSSSSFDINNVILRYDDYTITQIY